MAISAEGKKLSHFKINLRQAGQNISRLEFSHVELGSRPLEKGRTIAFDNCHCWDLHLQLHLRKKYVNDEDFFEVK